MATNKKVPSKAKNKVERKAVSAAMKKTIIGPVIYDDDGHIIGIINGIIRDPWRQQFKDLLSASKLKTVYAQEKAVRTAAKELVKQSKKFKATIEKL